MNWKNKLPLLLLFTLFKTGAIAQTTPAFTAADTLRGSDGPGRNWWDVTHYNLSVNFNIPDSSISGYNDIAFKVLKKGTEMQVDLQVPMQIDSVLLQATNSATNNSTWQAASAGDIRRQGNAWFIKMPAKGLLKGSRYSMRIYYHGKPTVARRPPWDGGVIWKKDSNNNPWVSIACQGLGASVWYPCKDIQSDEPDSAAMHITIPDTLQAISNGRLRGMVQHRNGTATYSWAVTNPINSYNFIPYIGKYAHFNEVYNGQLGKLDMDYWVLAYNVDKARAQFKDAVRTMQALEHWFGPYPFYTDSYKLVEAPHLGMEHQSAVAYGNKFQNGYLGRDLSGSGWGLKWDFIIVHESGHEWFGNNITSKDIADMWVHESFTNYSETLFTEFFYGKQAGTEYIIGSRKNIRNDIPITGPYNVNREGSGDMYPKGANMIHSIRQVINNDSVFIKILRGLNKSFYHQTVTARQVQQYINTTSKINFDKVFNQYLLTTQIPTLEYQQNGYTLRYRYVNCIKGFNMPLKINFKGQRWIKPTEKWQTLSLYPEGDNTFSVDPNFYINTKKVD
jgi:aminopeptidase N